MSRFADWGPASPLAIAMEESDRRDGEAFNRMMSVHLYGRQHIVQPYRLPTHKLRARAVYGGRKGRAAIKRLRARGCLPVYMYLRSTTPIQNWKVTL